MGSRRCTTDRMSSGAGSGRVRTLPEAVDATGAPSQRGSASDGRRISGTRRKAPTPRAGDLSLTVTHEHDFPSDYFRVSEFVEELLAPREGVLSPSVRDELSLALRELLLNAIEHGNLGLGFEDKSRALAAGQWKQIVTARARQLPFRNRRARVTAHWAPERVSFTICDEGNGFDWRSLPDPTNPENILCDHGRGILMARLSVDALYFNAAGNEVTIVKDLGPDPLSTAD